MRESESAFFYSSRKQQRRCLLNLASLLLRTDGRRKIQFNCYYSSHALKIKEDENYVNLLGWIRTLQEIFIQWLNQIEINAWFSIYDPVHSSSSRAWKMPQLWT